METEILETVEPETESTIDTTTAYADLRAKYNMYIQTLFFQEKISASFEVKQLQDWLESIRGNHEEIEKARMNFQNLSVPIMKEQISKKRHSVARLQAARSSNAISQQSFNEWITWLEDSNNDSQLVLDSMATTLTAYLDKRNALARKRAIINTKEFEPLKASNDPTMKALVSKITDDNYYFSLPFTQREKLVIEVIATLPVANHELKVFSEFKAELDKALGDKVISSASHKRWIARFKNPSINTQARVYFVQSQFPSYKDAWYKVHNERQKIIDSEPLLKEMTNKDWKDLKTFTNNDAFTALHFDAKQNLVKEVRAAITAKKTGKENVLKEASAVLTSAVKLGIVSANKVGGWQELIMSGTKTIEQLKGEYLPRWTESSKKFERAEFLMLEKGVPNGFNKLSKEQFLMLTTNRRENYVELVHQALREENLNRPDTPLKDMLGKVRHAFTTDNWEEAKYYLGLAWPLAKEDSDIRELQSMEKYLQSFGKNSEADTFNESADDAYRKAHQEIETVLHLLPASLQPVYRKALAKGPACLQCVTTCVYNRTWCEERGYLDGAIEEELREKAIIETAQRVRSGGDGHDNGVENNFVDGHNQPAIRDQGVGPQNLFMSGSGADAFIEKADANKNTFTFWYWTNLIVDGVSSAQNAYVSYALNHRLKSAARTLDSLGKRYDPVGPRFSLN